jgi:predicted metal-dependent hydrolase
MQTPLPGFSLPSLPAPYPGILTIKGREYPYDVTYTQEKSDFTLHITEKGLLKVTAPASWSKITIHQQLEKEAPRIIRICNPPGMQSDIPESSVVILQGCEIPYTISRSSRRKHCVVSISAEGTLEVKARPDTSMETITALLAEHETWIYRNVLDRDPRFKREPEELSLVVGNEKILFKITYSPRVSQITLKVSPLHPVNVTAPVDASQESVHQFIQNNMRWIEEARNPGKRVSGSGETRIATIQRTSISYHLTRNPRAKRIILKITPDASLHVSAPPQAPVSLIEKVMMEKFDWILENQKRREEAGIYERLYQEGEMLPILGVEKRLVIVQTSGHPTASEIDDTIEVTVPPDLTPESRKGAIQYAYMMLLEQQMYEQAASLIPAWSSKIGVSPPQVKFANQKTKWGVCTHKGIILNIRLAMAPVPILEYVMVHELCHLIHHNHSKQFWKLVGEMLPDFAERRAMLKRDGNRYRL